MSMFLNLQDPPRRFIQAALDRQVILIISEATSGAASTGVAVLEAVPEVAKTNRLYNKLTNSVLHAFSLMHLIEAKDLRDVITMTYSNSKSRF